MDQMDPMDLNGRKYFSNIKVHLVHSVYLVHLVHLSFVLIRKAVNYPIHLMKRPFREHHLIEFLEKYEKQSLPLDLFLNHYFRAHKALGSKDRAYLAETIFGIIRWQGFLDYLCGKPVTWEKRIAKFKDFESFEKIKNKDIPLHVKVSFPKYLFDLIVKSHGENKAVEICLASNLPAPTTIRVNPLKTTRDEFLQKLEEKGYPVIPCKYSELGITFQKRVQFTTLEEYKEGFFEVQDEGSQLIADLVQAKPGQQVIDYCSGSGGKTLAFAPFMQNKGQIFLHDIRPAILQDSRKRLRRAGIQNAQVVQNEDPKLRSLQNRMNWVLVDVPCSGTGTLRRNPDIKWKLDAETLNELIDVQRTIFEKALSFLNPKGHIVYATCSILDEENKEQVAHFLKTYDLELVKTFVSLPTEGGMDGFFGAVMRKKNEEKGQKGH